MITMHKTVETEVDVEVEFGIDDIFEQFDERGMANFIGELIEEFTGRCRSKSARENLAGTIVNSEIVTPTIDLSDEISQITAQVNADGRGKISTDSGDLSFDAKKMNVKDGDTLMLYYCADRLVLKKKEEADGLLKALVKEDDIPF